jgi:hypothetical protein
MADEFSSPTNIQWQGDVGVVEYGGGDRSMVVLFYNRPMLNPAKSKELGHPYHEDKIYIRVHPPGERLNITDRPVTEQDTRRWPMQWQQFRQQKEQRPDGAPIELLYPEQPAIAATLRACNVLTIEQCAELSAHAIEQIGMGAQQYSNYAQKWLENASKGASLSQMRGELEVRDRELKVLRQQVGELKNTIEQMRSSTLGQPDLRQVQALIAQAMERPVNMPSQQFDVQAAMINAMDHEKRTPYRAPPKRQRPRLAK